MEDWLFGPMVVKSGNMMKVWNFKQGSDMIKA